MSPPTPSLNVESCKIVSFRRGGYSTHVYLHNLDSRGYRGLSFTLCVLPLRTYTPVQELQNLFLPPSPLYVRLSGLYLLGANFLLWSALRGFLCPGPFGGRGVPGVIGGRHWGVTSALALSGGGRFQGLSGGLSFTLGLVPLRTDILLKIRKFVFLPPSPFYVRLFALYRLYVFDWRHLFVVVANHILRHRSLADINHIEVLRHCSLAISFPMGRLWDAYGTPMGRLWDAYGTAYGTVKGILACDTNPTHHRHK